MANQLKSDHYIYFLKDKEGVIRYVGSGRQLRYKRTQNRTEEFKRILEDGGYFEFPHEGLTKQEAMQIESEYLDNIGVVNDTWNLTNKVKSRKNNNVDLIYEDLSKYLYLDETSSTLVRWKDDAVALGLSKNSVCVKKGAQAGWPTTKSNYGGLQIAKKTFPIHRVLWCLYNKTNLPWYLVVNHIDSDTTNNSKDNLEAVTFSTNSKKKKKQHNNSSGVCGVAHSKANNSYVAHIYIDGMRKDKYFSISKFGAEKALALAKDWRAEMEKIHYSEKFVTHAQAVLEGVSND